MEISERPKGGAVILDLAGKLHHASGDVQLREAVDGVLDRGVRRLVLNFAQVKSIDSSGLGELVRSKVTAGKRDAAIKILNLDMRGYELLSMAQLVPLFDLYDDEDEALASFG